MTLAVLPLNWHAEFIATFLLWNVQHKRRNRLIVRLIEDHGVDAVILIEKPESDDGLLRNLRRVGDFKRLESHGRFGVYTRLASFFERLTPLIDSDRCEFWRIAPRQAPDILLAVVHGLDRLNHSEDRRALFFQRVTANIRHLEVRLRHSRTILVGDFNANPFEPSIGGVQGLHAIRMKEVAGRSARTVLGEEYPFFYNPMWIRFGKSPPSSYFWNGSGVHEIFWHILDQVVLRPEAIPWFPENRLRIIDRASADSLLTKSGIPDKIHASDHLPVLFELDFNRGA